MEKAKEIGNIALWLVGHLAFTLIVNLTALGGYYAYTQYQALTPKAITGEMIASMPDSDLNELSKDIYAIQQDRNKKKG